MLLISSMITCMCHVIIAQYKENKISYTRYRNRYHSNAIIIRIKWRHRDIIFFSSFPLFSFLFRRIISYTGELWDIWSPENEHAEYQQKCRPFRRIRGWAYLPLVGKGKPSNTHDTCGVGFPAAEHFKDTAGPGWSVCSMNEYRSTGGASGTLSRA